LICSVWQRPTATYKTDLLKLYSGNKVIYTMSLSSVAGGTLTASSIGVEKTSTGVSVFMDRGFTNPTELLPTHQHVRVTMLDEGSK
jgi:hypothetical protein